MSFLQVFEVVSAGYSNWATAICIAMVLAVVALVAWALKLMQAANEKQEFSLMLAGCMVCSAAVGLALVMVITLAGPNAPLVHVFQ
ncbi:hypothetical protein [Synechococcus sp. UW140]|uniref:hypothetical protein n=1 Tax=Synechococcus sp. UW140 TaxID=368503 RepID=UPI0025D90768|nr:hypothetical protein [Synechococcus sp. UW140]